VQREGTIIRITAQLINVEDGYHLWSEKFDENSGTLFEIQDKIASAIAEKFSLTTSLPNANTVARAPTESKEAHELYLKGRFFWNLRQPGALKKGIEFFEKAIAIDPQYAEAWSGIADCYTALGWGSFLAPRDAFPKAEAAASRALALDSTLAEPHASLGYYRLYYDRDWIAAEKEFQKAIALNPKYEIAYDWYATYLTAMGRFPEARAIMKKALDLDPLSHVFGSDMGFTLFYGGSYDESIKELQSVLDLNPKYPIAHLWLSRAYQQKKMYKESIAEYRKTLQVIPAWPVALAGIGNIYGEMQNKKEAQKMLDTLTLVSSKAYVTSYGVALIYAGLRDHDRAFQWLDKAYEERSNFLVWLKVEPRWGRMRSDPRYDALVRRVGL
jgi:tetratricopeptide (TPR) repeat protein